MKPSIIASAHLRPSVGVVWSTVAALAITLALAACGQKGPLTPPSRSATPSAAAAAAASASTPTPAAATPGST
ncbi:MAG: LPS translocon maturation chaperone LptM, partial [Betaproteobacteria bacterium]